MYKNPANRVKQPVNPNKDATFLIILFKGDHNMIIDIDVHVSLNLVCESESIENMIQGQHNCNC